MGRSKHLMHTIAVLSNDRKIDQAVEKACEGFDEVFHPVFLPDEERFVQFLNYELPEIDIVLYRKERFHVDHAFDVIKNDPWLHFGGSIVLHDDQPENELLRKFRGVNIIAFVRESQIESHLPRVLRVLNENRGILFQRDIHALLQSNLSGIFTMENDPFEVSVYSNLLANFLYNSNLIGLDEKHQFNMCLMELLVNAIEHGNCGISFEEKRDFLAANEDIMELIRLRLQDPEVALRHVYLTYKITPQKSEYRVRDEGAGFDWKRYTEGDRSEAPVGVHGRGIGIARHYLGEMRYNEAGNEVRFSLQHREDESNALPRVFDDQTEVEFQKGDTVFKEGEKSSHLYYIISGRFDIFHNGRMLSSLTPADIFLGEMSFLLNNKRSATVVAGTKATAVRISKEDFINAIRREPHYGMFLARLLAQRLEQLHDVQV